MAIRFAVSETESPRQRREREKHTEKNHHAELGFSNVGTVTVELVSGIVTDAVKLHQTQWLKAYKACTCSLSLYSLRKMILRDPQVAKPGKCQVNTKGA